MRQLCHRRFERKGLVSSISTLCCESVACHDTRSSRAVSAWAVRRALRVECFVLFLVSEYLPSCAQCLRDTISLLFDWLKVIHCELISRASNLCSVSQAFTGYQPNRGMVKRAQQVVPLASLEALGIVVTLFGLRVEARVPTADIATVPFRSGCSAGRFHLCT